LEDQVLDIMS